jgi:hypothetical protein
MVVVTRPVMDLAARMTALHLDCCVPDVEAFAEPVLEVAHHVFCLRERAVSDDDVHAEGHFV